MKVSCSKREYLRVNEKEAGRREKVKKEQDFKYLSLTVRQQGLWKRREEECQERNLLP